MDLEIGDLIELYVWDNDGGERQAMGIAQVERIDHLRYRDLEPIHVVTNHSKRNAGNRDALLAAMRKAYGEGFIEG